MSKHTPGPWTTRRAGVGHDRDIGIVAPGCAGVIAECFEEFVHKGDRRPQEAEANARLISKAWLLPELVEALREIEKGEGPFSRDPMTHAENTIEHAKKVAREALARYDETER